MPQHLDRRDECNVEPARFEIIGQAARIIERQLGLGKQFRKPLDERLRVQIIDRTDTYGPTDRRSHHDSFSIPGMFADRSAAVLPHRMWDRVATFKRFLVINRRRTPDLRTTRAD